MRVALLHSWGARAVTLPADPRALQRLLDKLSDIAAMEIAGGLAPPVYESRVRYRRERGTEDWQSPAVAWHNGFGDCEDLSAWRAGELVASGVDPTARAVLVRAAPGLLHALVSRRDGRYLEDPSRAAGMGRGHNMRLAIAPLGDGRWGAQIGVPSRDGLLVARGIGDTRALAIGAAAGYALNLLREDHDTGIEIGADSINRTPAAVHADAGGRGASLSGGSQGDWRAALDTASQAYQAASGGDPADYGYAAVESIPYIGPWLARGMRYLAEKYGAHTIETIRDVMFTDAGGRGRGVFRPVVPPGESADYWQGQIVEVSRPGAPTNRELRYPHGDPVEHAGWEIAPEANAALAEDPPNATVVAALLRYGWTPEVLDETIRAARRAAGKPESPMDAGGKRRVPTPTKRPAPRFTPPTGRGLPGIPRLPSVRPPLVTRPQADRLVLTRTLADAVSAEDWAIVRDLEARITDARVRKVIRTAFGAWW